MSAELRRQLNDAMKENSRLTRALRERDELLVETHQEFKKRDFGRWYHLTSKLSNRLKKWGLIVE